MLAGTPSSAADRASRSRLYALHPMKSETARLKAGSMRSHPVAATPSAPMTTAAEIAASPSICRKAPRRLMSSRWPRMNSQAVRPLIRMPVLATTVTIVESIATGAASRATDSNAIAPAAASRSAALISAASRPARRHPHVKRGLVGWRAAQAPPQASASARTSPRLCPASDSSAIESARQPAAASMATKPVFRTMAARNSRPWPSGEG